MTFFSPSCCKHFLETFFPVLVTALICASYPSLAFDLSYIDSVLSQRVCHQEMQEYYIEQKMSEACPTNGPNVDYWQLDRCQSEYSKASKKVDEYNSFVRGCRRLFDAGAVKTVVPDAPSKTGSNGGTDVPTEGSDTSLSGRLKDAKLRASVDAAKRPGIDEAFDTSVDKSRAAEIDRTVDEMRKKIDASRIAAENRGKANEAQTGSEVTGAGITEAEFIQPCSHVNELSVSDNIYRCWRYDDYLWPDTPATHTAMCNVDSITVINGKRYIYCGGTRY